MSIRNSNNKKIKTIVILSIVSIILILIIWQLSLKGKINGLFENEKYAEAYKKIDYIILFKDKDLEQKVKILGKMEENLNRGKYELDELEERQSSSYKTTLKHLIKYDLEGVIETAIGYNDVAEKLDIIDKVVELRNEAVKLFIQNLDFDLEKELNNHNTEKSVIYSPLHETNKDKVKELIDEVIKKAASYENENTYKMYIKNNSVKLTAKEIQYNMSNNINREFTLEGIGELDDYYNYGYDKAESGYFCIFVTPNNGTYSDSWYIYCDRYEYREIYNKLLKRKQSLKLVCKIEGWRYEENQGNMATATFIEIK